MTTTATTDPDTPQDGPQATPDGPEAPDPAPDTPTAPETAPDDQDDTDQEPDTFPAAVVKELRDENAKLRVRSKRSDDLAQQLVTVMADKTGKMADPTDLPYSETMLDDDGMPDPAKVEAAVTQLLKKKPHLKSRRPTGDVGQGAQEEEGAVSLADILRAGA